MGRISNQRTYFWKALIIIRRLKKELIKGKNSNLVNLINLIFITNIL